MTTQLTTSGPRAITIIDWERFEQFTTAALRTVAESSQRIYASVFHAWATWCEERGLVPLDLRPVHVTDFIEAGQTAFSTRQMQFSALRNLALMVATLEANSTNQANYNALLLTKVPKAGAVESDREMRALEPEEVDQVLAAWSGPKPIDKRNRALIAVLFATALRRAEAAALRWDDINFTDGTLIVRHGKGDKFREVSIAGEFAIPALMAWRRALGIKRCFVFCPLTSKGGIGQDRAINAQGVYRAVVSTEKETGISFKPHDARRTHITEGLGNGVPLHDMQAQAGHARGDTTLKYAHAVNAKRRQPKLKLRYGKKK